jgi:uncharacterized protein YcaQ
MARKRKGSGGWYGDSKRHADAGHQAHENRLQTLCRRVKWKLSDLVSRLIP